MRVSRTRLTDGLLTLHARSQGSGSCRRVGAGHDPGRNESGATRRSGIRAALDKGRDGEIYNIGGNRSLPNLEVVKKILAGTGKPESLIQYVNDRPGHDRRYALTSAKLMRETGWAPQVQFEEGLALTIQWYKDNQGWVQRVKSGEYLKFYETNYANR